VARGGLDSTAATELTEKIVFANKKVWAGRIISALPVLLLLFSGVMKLMKPPAVVEGFAHYGLPMSLALGIGILEIACTVVYVIPQTSVLGAILMTAYLGGATATNVRVGDPSFAGRHGRSRSTGLGRNILAR